MIFHQNVLYFVAIASFTGAVKVNMHGSLSLGKEVMDTITYYLRSGYKPLLSGRRSMYAKIDPIQLEVKEASLCKDLQFCQENLEKFVNEYVTTLAQTVDRVFDGILNPGKNFKGTFLWKLKGFLNQVRKVLTTANDKVNDEREVELWVGAIKKISAKFQKKTITYIFDKLEADSLEIGKIKKKLTQLAVIHIAIEESKALKRLCYEFHICLDHNECTTALNALLGRLGKAPNDKVKSFMKAFYEVLDETRFYYILSEETSKQFKVILNNMSHSDDVPTKAILKSVQGTVEMRLNTMRIATDLTKGQDMQLVHSILSDMDYLYSKHKPGPFRDILDHFLEWARVGGRKISSYMKDAIKNIKNVLSTASDELIYKLVNEVKVFLEITVDSEE